MRLFELGSLVYCSVLGLKKLTAVGFEPTRIAPSELESDALDHSATLSCTKERLPSNKYCLAKLYISRSMRQIRNDPERIRTTFFQAAIAQLGERQTEDLEVPGSIPGLGIFVHI